MCFIGFENVILCKFLKQPNVLGRGLKAGDEWGISENVWIIDLQFCRDNSRINHICHTWRRRQRPQLETLVLGGVLLIRWGFCSRPLWNHQQWSKYLKLAIIWNLSPFTWEPCIVLKIAWYHFSTMNTYRSYSLGWWV